ncbi:hypothetical protein J0S82_016980, partial [Galemys pyrenaicus]
SCHSPRLTQNLEQNLTGNESVSELEDRHTDNQTNQASWQQQLKLMKSSKAKQLQCLKAPSFRHLHSYLNKPNWKLPRKLKF